MQIEYRYFSEKGYVISRPKGVLNLHDVVTYARALQQDESICAPFMEVVDFSQIERFDFGYFEASELVAEFLPLIESKGYKGSCLVVQDDVTRGMSNLLNDVGREVGVPITTFRTLEDACAYAEYNHR